MNEASITIEEAENGIKIAKISGQLDESNIDEKIQQLYKTVEATPKGLKLLFDLENLEYMNSKSIGYLTDLYGKITEAGGKVVIAKARPNIIDILQVVGLTQLINSYDTTEEAKTALAGDGTPTPETPPTPEAPTEEKPAEAPTPETAPVEDPVKDPAEGGAEGGAENGAEAPTPEPAPEAPTAPVVETPAPTPEPAPEAPTAPVTETPAEKTPTETPPAPTAPSETPAPSAPQEEGGTYKFE